MKFEIDIHKLDANGPEPIPVLTCQDTAELGLPSIHSYGYEFQSSPAFSRIFTASASGILAQYTGSR
jgi:hypothetical protein